MKNLYLKKDSTKPLESLSYAEWDIYIYIGTIDKSR